MIQTAIDLFNLFRKGNEVANPEAWKDGGNAAVLLAPALVALVKALGDFHVVTAQLSMQDALTISGGLVTAVLFVIHNITSKRAGLLPAKVADGAGQVVEPVQSPTDRVLNKLASSIVSGNEKITLATERVPTNDKTPDATQQAERQANQTFDQRG